MRPSGGHGETANGKPLRRRRSRSRPRVGAPRHHVSRRSAGVQHPAVGRPGHRERRERHRVDRLAGSRRSARPRSRTSLSSPADARNRPSGENRTALTPPRWAASRFASAPLAASLTITSPDSPPAARPPLAVGRVAERGGAAQGGRDVSVPAAGRRASPVGQAISQADCPPGRRASGHRDRTPKVLRCVPGADARRRRRGESDSRRERRPRAGRGGAASSLLQHRARM